MPRHILSMSASSSSFSCFFFIFLSQFSYPIPHVHNFFSLFKQNDRNICHLNKKKRMRKYKRKEITLIFYLSFVHFLFLFLLFFYFKNNNARGWQAFIAFKLTKELILYKVTNY